MAEFIPDYAKKRMVVRCRGFDEARPLHKLPSKRWKQEKNEFVVPFTRMNAQMILDSFLVPQIPSELLAVLRKTADSTIGTRQFPQWYTHKMQPFTNQREATEKLYRDDMGAFLMPMGTGKSKALIDVCTAHFYEKRIEAVVLLAPLTTVGVWTGVKGQLETHSPVKYWGVHADSSFDWTRYRPEADELLWLTVGIESLSQGNTVKKVMPFLEHYKCAIAVDESHYIKNHAAIRTQRAIELRQLALFAYIMTGTLATVNMIDMYAQYNFLDPNIIGVGDYYAFRNRYCLMGGFKQRDVVGYDNVEELMSLIEPYTYICDVPKDLPPQLWTKREIRMHPEQEEMMRKVKKAEVEGVSVKNCLTRVLRQHQICGGFLFTDPKTVVGPDGRKKKIPGECIWKLEPDKNPKLQTLIELIEQEPDVQVLVWAKYLPEIEMIAEALRKIGPTAVMIGATPMEERAQIVADFQAGKYKHLVGNQQIAGLSWTLTAATRGYYYSNTDKLDDRLQSEKRPHRHGQTNSVLYIDLEMKTARGGMTADSVILGSIDDKKDLDQYIKDKIREAGGKAMLEEVV